MIEISASTQETVQNLHLSINTNVSMFFVGQSKHYDWEQKDIHFRNRVKYIYTNKTKNIYEV